VLREWAQRHPEPASTLRGREHTQALSLRGRLPPPVHPLCDLDDLPEQFPIHTSNTFSLNRTMTSMPVQKVLDKIPYTRYV